MTQYQQHARAPGNIVIIGFGAIAQGVLPLILRHIVIDPHDITIVTSDERGAAVAKHYGITMMLHALTPHNYRDVLSPLMSAGTFIVNLSVDVSSIALMELCQEKAALYIDTCIEPWQGGYTDKNLSASQRSNYALRHQALQLREKYNNAHTAVICQGANPGMVSHFVKQALMNLQRDLLGRDTEPATREQWAALAQQLNIKTIHIAERDNQISSQPKRIGEFVNTWSCDGFVSEGAQPAELGWGTHEKHFPHDGIRHEFGNGCGIILKRPGAATRVRSWAPHEGHYHGWLITHNEALSIADYLTVWQNGHAVYRPSCHYSYHPCDNAVLSLHELNGRNFQMQTTQRIMCDDVVSGHDELGVLLAGHDKNAYWFGSELTIEAARKLAPHNSATSLQVTSAVLAGMVWAIENPRAGFVESDDMDYRRNLEVQSVYLGKMHGVYTQWNPLVQREALFDEDLDRTDPWQFKNVRVV